MVRTMKRDTVRFAAIASDEHATVYQRVTPEPKGGAMTKFVAQRPFAPDIIDIQTDWDVDVASKRLDCKVIALEREP